MYMPVFTMAVGQLQIFCLTLRKTLMTPKIAAIVSIGSTCIREPERRYRVPENPEWRYRVPERAGNIDAACAHRILLRCHSVSSASVCWPCRSADAAFYSE